MLDELRFSIARLERNGAVAQGRSHRPFGCPALDAALPDGGLFLSAVHEVAGAGAGIEHGTVAALFVAGVLARLPGPVLWALERRDLFAPGLAGVGLPPERILYAEAGTPALVLLVVEEGLRHRGLAGVVGELRTSVCGRLNQACDDGLNVTHLREEVTCRFCLRMMARLTPTDHPRERKL